MADKLIKKFVVTRFDPDQDEAPRSETYEVPCHPDWKVLDALNHIKDELELGILGGGTGT